VPHLNFIKSLSYGTVSAWDEFLTNDHPEHERVPAFFARIDAFRPDCIFHIPTILAKPGNLPPHAFGHARRALGIPVINCHLDAVKPVWREMVVHLSEEADLVVLVDGAPMEPFAKRFPHGETRCIALWPPIPSDIVDGHRAATDSRVRDADVSFAGTLSGYVDRSDTIDHLRANGIDVVCSSSAVDMTADDYYQVLRRSRIVINFATIQNWRKYSVRPIYQLKARVFEAAACGAFLLEQANPLTPRFFEPGIEYGSFTDPADAVTKIRRYLQDTATREAMAARMHTSFMAKYHPRIFWERVFAAL
jgi:hypothetical protein